MSEKQKIEGVDNKELILFVSIIVVLIMLLIFEKFFFTGRKEIQEEQVKAQQYIEEIQNTTIPNEQKKVYKVLTNIISMMNNKQYEDLYKMLKDDYKRYYFDNYENFEKFIKSYASEEYYPKYTSYYRDGDFYYIMVDFLKSKYTREDFLDPMGIKVDTIVLEEQKNGSFKFAMHGFVENIEHNKSKTVDGVTFTLKNSVRNTETMKTTVMISNNSEKTITVSTNNLIPDVVGGNSAIVSVTSVITLDPNEIGALDVEYYLQYNSKKEFQGLTITDVNFDDGTLIEDVYLSR